MDKSKWEYKKWENVLDIINGRDYKSVVDPNGIYPICGSGGIMGHANSYLCPENSVIIGRKGNINHPIFMNEKYWNVDTAFGLVAKEGILLPKFLFYFCDWYDFEKHNKAVTIPSLTKRDLLKIQIQIPSITDQQRIVSELDQLNELISLKQEQLKEYDALAQSIFYEMFGDPATNEKQWNLYYIKDIALVRIGPFGSLLHTKDYITGGTPLVNPIHMHDGKIDADLDFTVSESKLKGLSSYLLETNDIVFGRRGDIGRCALVTDKESGYVCGTGSLFVRFQKNINPLYSLYALSDKSSKDYLLKHAKGATMLNINCKVVENMLIPLPPLSLQHSFATKIRAIEAQKDLLKQSIGVLQTLLASRMQEYFA